MTLFLVWRYFVLTSNFWIIFRQKISNSILIGYFQPICADLSCFKTTMRCQLWRGDGSSSEQVMTTICHRLVEDGSWCPFSKEVTGAARGEDCTVRSNVSWVMSHGTPYRQTDGLTEGQVWKHDLNAGGNPGNHDAKTSEYKYRRCNFYFLFLRKFLF